MSCDEKKVLLEVKGITKRFPGTTALQDVSFSIYTSEIHAIMGANGAGKSTLMNILSGVFPPTEGEMMLEGESVQFHSPKDAQSKGISIVHQELSLCPHLSVAENIFMGRVPKTRWGLIDFPKLYKETQELLDRFNLPTITPQTITGNLNVSEQQIVEIAKALSFDCKLLILDEPTSSLSEAEVEKLFQIIRDLCNHGVSILYISHKFKEIFSLCHRISVFRDGKYVDGDLTENLTSESVVQLMVGRSIEAYYPPKGSASSECIFRVEQLSRQGVFEDINFELYKGEIIGVFGLVGAGRTEIARAIAGIDPKDKGTIYAHGKKVEIRSVREAIEAGIVYLTEDRKEQGLFLEMDLHANTVAPVISKVSKMGLIDSTEVGRLSEKYTTLLNVKYSSLQEKVRNLSGGNQQKLMIGKWLSTNPQLIIMDEPTRGIDVGAKSEIHNLLRSLANKGIGIIVISSELSEIIGVSDRILIIHEGKMTAMLAGEEATEEVIMTYASGL